MALEPSLWGTLPKELLHLVFARLPVAGIGQLRVLSKEWKRNVDCKDSEFNQVFDATAHFNMFALLYSTYSGGFEYSSNIYDLQADKWHVSKINAAFVKFAFLDGADGGLLCCVSKRYWCNNEPGFFIVMNPLTKQKTQLPPLLSMGAEKNNTLVTVVRMVKLTMDKKTKKYKVFVVGIIENGGRGFFAQVYDSHIKEWTVVEATQGHIIGWDYLGSNSIDYAFCRSLCVYNCGDGTLQHFSGADIAPGFEVGMHSCVLLEDHLFVLHKEVTPDPYLLEEDASKLQKYCILEFHLPEKSTSWVKLGVRSCGPCECFRDTPPPSILIGRLWGCNGFLLVSGDGSERAWLYNLSTGEWRNLAAFAKPLYIRNLCEISWSAIA